MDGTNGKLILPDKYAHACAGFVNAIVTYGKLKKPAKLLGKTIYRVQVGV